jgi:sialate O-acetylesterase
VVVWSDEVKNPVTVQFAWERIPEINLYNKAGLPASPFQTDTWPAETYGKN